MDLALLVSLGTISGFALGMFVGIRYPVRVKLVTEKIEDLKTEALKKAVDEGVERIKRLRK